MLKEQIQVSFFTIQAIFCFTDTNFNEAKFEKDSLINRNSLSRKPVLTKPQYRAERKKTINKFVYLYNIVIF